jgi:serine phosphatase RsbU (regulator of sigma subunit)
MPLVTPRSSTESPSAGRLWDATDNTPCVPGLEVGGWTRAATDAGRESISCWLLPDGRLGLFLGHVLGDGPHADEIIARVAALFRTLGEVRAEPDWMLARANARLRLEGAAPTGVTAFVGCLGGDGILTWASAGQGPIYIRTTARGSFLASAAQWPPLGVEPQLRARRPAIHVLGKGGRVAVLSEGVLEAENGAGRPLGPQRAKTVLDSTEGVPLQRTLEIVRDVVTTWQAGEPPDGQAVLIAERCE